MPSYIDYLNYNFIFYICQYNIFIYYFYNVILYINRSIIWNAEDIIMKKELSKTSANKNIQNFEAQFKKSTTQLLVLHFLSKEEMYAYDIIRKTLELSNNVYKMPLLYNILNRLEEDNYIMQSRREVSKTNRVRVYYKITSNGLQYLLDLKHCYMQLSESVNNILFGEDSTT